MTCPTLNDPYRDADFCRGLLERLPRILPAGGMRFMEVCGTHTVALFRSGLRSLLPAAVRHVSGPGCPVCVTHEADVAAILELAMLENVILATFGDLMRVPGPGGFSLWHARARGADVRVVYSPLDAVELARQNPRRQTVFPAIGFETTAPVAAAAILAAERLGLDNFSILALNKSVPPVLEMILRNGDCGIDALMLPGHVCTITGETPFEPIAAGFSIPCVISGFERSDIALALCLLARAKSHGGPALVNAYPRAVDRNGNPRAREIMNRVFRPGGALWRGLGRVPASGLELRGEYASFDARRRFAPKAPAARSASGCRCGDVLCGRIDPAECALFGRECTPAKPLGPCMVSSEGSCAAHFKYGAH